MILNRVREEERKRSRDESMTGHGRSDRGDIGPRGPGRERYSGFGTIAAHSIGTSDRKPQSHPSHS